MKIGSKGFYKDEGGKKIKNNEKCRIDWIKIKKIKNTSKLSMTNFCEKVDQI